MLFTMRSIKFWVVPALLPALLSAVLLAEGAIAADATALEASDEAENPSIELALDGVIEGAIDSDVEQTTTDAATLSDISEYSTGELSSDADLSADSMGQVTSVSQFSDVQPTDWAFQALQSLVERYGCIAGYPDGTYRGNRAMTRYEFAAGLNACLDRVNELIAAGLEDVATRDDLATLQRLQEEFAAELATLRGRVDALEARTAELEANQFSTTTTLSGETIFGVSDIFGDDVGDANNTVFQYRTRLNLNTSFTGRDRLRARLTFGNANGFATPASLPSVFPTETAGTAEGSLSQWVGADTDNSVTLERLDYRFNVGDRLEFYLAGTGGVHNDYVFSTVNPFFEDFDGGQGGITAFSQSSPIYRVGGGAGIGLNYSFDANDTLVLSLGYLAEEANDSGLGSGLFNGDYAALGQLTFTPSDAFQVAFTYVNGYHGTDSAIFDLGFRDRFFTGSVPANGIHIDSRIDTPAVTNSYGIQASFRLNPGFVINGFAGYTDLILTETGDGEIWYYGLGLAFPDLLREGNLGGIMVGVEPYLGGLTGNSTLADLRLENETSLHIEAFYRYQVTDNISITPGIVWVTAPEQSGATADYVIGTVRTTFRF